MRNDIAGKIFYSIQDCRFAPMDLTAVKSR